MQLGECSFSIECESTQGSSGFRIKPRLLCKAFPCCTGHPQTLCELLQQHQHPAQNHIAFSLKDEMSAHLEGALGLHGEQVSVEGDQVQAVLLAVDEGAQHALLLQPLLAQEAAAWHEQDVEIPLWGAAPVLPGEVTAGTHGPSLHREQRRPRAGGTGLLLIPGF